MKIGKIHLADWMTPIVNGTRYFCWYRIESGIIFDGNHQNTNCVFINCGGPGKHWPEFCGDLKFLENIYRPRELKSYEEAMRYTDNFLHKMDNLIIFT